MIEKTIRVLKALADRSRLRVAAALLERPHCVEELAERLSLSPSTVSFHLKKLEDAELVSMAREQYYAVYTLHPESLDMTLRNLLRNASEDENTDRTGMDAYRKKVLATFFRHGKLVRIPVQRKKRRIVLEKILESFEPGKVYPEKEVNLIIAEFHDDFCTLRREMICEKLMERDSRGYKRGNGSVP